jgi:hypothetical protein
VDPPFRDTLISTGPPMRSGGEGFMACAFVYAPRPVAGREPALDFAVAVESILAHPNDTNSVGNTRNFIKYFMIFFSFFF